MTPAVRALEKAGIPFHVHEFEHVAGSSDFGREAAAALGVEIPRVFKTLVVVGDDRPAVAIVPVTGELSLKGAARALGVKRVTMCDPTVAERMTGYVVGGISPFGQRKRLATVVDVSAE